MRKFKVIALSVGGNNNKIYHSQQIVDERCFYPEHVQELIDGGFLEVVNEGTPSYQSPDEPLESEPQEKEKEVTPKPKKSGTTRANKA